MFSIKMYKEWSYILLKKKEVNLNLQVPFSEWANKVINTESVKKGFW